MGKLALTVKGRRDDYACDGQPLGRGGYAEVFAATHKPSGERVALKRLRKGIAIEEGRRRMKREIAAMRELAGEPNVMPVLDADPHHGWYVMPLAVTDANAWQSRLGDRELAAMLAAVCEALVVAHAAGYIHRDITPHNVLYLEDEDGERWVLADWGLVRIPSGSSTTITTTGAVIGTDGFIAPEVLRGGEASEASDVFSLDAELLALADENPDDAELYLDFLAPVRRGEIAAYVRSEPEAAGRIAAAMSRHVREDFHGNFDHMNIPLRFVWDVAALAAEHSEFGLLEDVAAVLFEAEASCVRYEQRRRTRSWLEGLRGQAAAAVARSLAAVPAGAEWHLEEDWSPSRQSDPQIRGAFHAAATAAVQ